MKLYKLIFILCIILVQSCSTKKDVLLVQDLDDNFLSNIKYNQYQIKVDDILKIDVSSESMELSLIYNKNFNGTTLPNRESIILNGYLVNSQGNINFPNIGNMYVVGLTTTEVSDLIFNNLVSKGFLANPLVDVKVVNSYFTILGEVKLPGRYNFIENNMDILTAIGIAGDLTINAKRTDLKIIRNKKNKRTISTIDLTNSDFLKSNDFQVNPGDIIIVNPNNSRVKNAGIIGNSGTLLSLLSFILSSIIVISNS